MLSRLLSLARAHSGVALFYLARSVPGIINFYLVFALGNSLSKGEYGKFSIWFAFAIGGGFLFFGWIAQAIARHANAKDDLLGQQPEAFVIAIVAASVASYGCASGFAALSFDGLSSADAYLLATSIMLYGVHSAWSAALQARLYVKRYVLIELIRPVAIVCSVLCFVARGGVDYRAAIVGYVCGQAAGVVLAGVVIRSNLIRASTKLHAWWRDRSAAVLGALKSLFVYGAPISVWLGISSCWPALERILLTYVLGANEAGRYALEYDVVVRSFVFTLLPLTLFAQPHIFRAFSRGDLGAVSRLLRGSISAQLIVGALYAACLDFGLAAFGHEVGFFSDMRVSDVSVLCASAVVWQVALMCHKWIECNKRVWFMVATLVLAHGFVSLPLARLLIGGLGAKAFAVGTFFGGLVYCVVCFVYGRRISFTSAPEIGREGA